MTFILGVCMYASIRVTATPHSVTVETASSLPILKENYLTVEAVGVFQDSLDKPFYHV